jgi:hypothetical protein
MRAEPNERLESHDMPKPRARNRKSAKSVPNDEAREEPTSSPARTSLGAGVVPAHATHAPNALGARIDWASL